MTETRGAVVEQLRSWTLAARNAACEGRWDLVAAYYERRAPYLSDSQLSPGETALLLESDYEIQHRIGVAQLALTAAIEQSACTLQRLSGLRQRLGAGSSESGTLLLEA